jgi:hypothetical protein
VNGILRFARVLAGLLFDDGDLAFVVIAVLAATAMLNRMDGVEGWAQGGFLVCGIGVALLENVLRTAHGSYPRVK